MAFNKLTNAAYLATNWQDEVTSKNLLKKGYSSASFTEMATSALPLLQSGSAVDINGVIYQCNTNITPSTTGAVDGLNYFYVYDSGGVGVANISVTAPTWDGIKNGWYNGSQRAVLKLTKSGTAYSNKIKLYGDNYSNIDYFNNRTIHSYITELAASNWALRTSASDISWKSVAYGNGLFVAVKNASGTGVMTSPDGITWTLRTGISEAFDSVVYGNGLFVAVGSPGIFQSAIMTSPDGITWTSRTPAAGTSKDLISVTYGNGLFVAVARESVTSCVMTSPDGITWTSRTGIARLWYSVTYGNGLFVAVSASGTGSRVMTSPDGITWTSRTSAADNNWISVTYGGGLFVAVSVSGTGNRVMTSPDGITWTSRTSAADNNWVSVTYGGGLFVAVSNTGSGNRVMTSPDGITWALKPSAIDNSWVSVTYGGGLFVAVSNTGSGNRVMTSLMT